MSQSPADNCVFVVVTALVVTSLLVAPSTAKSDIWLYDEAGDWDALFLITHQPAQRCFSFAHFIDKISFVEWDDIQENAWIMFYDEPNCRGKSAKYWAATSTFNAKTAGMDNNVQSYMVLESGLYPTRGIEDAYLSERTSLRVNASSVNRSVTIGDRNSDERSASGSSEDAEVVATVVVPSSTLNL